MGVDQALGGDVYGEFTLTIQESAFKILAKPLKSVQRQRDLTQHLSRFEIYVNNALELILILNQLVQLQLGQFQRLRRLRLLIFKSITKLLETITQGIDFSVRRNHFRQA